MNHDDEQPRTAPHRPVRGWRARSIDDRWDVYRYVLSAVWAALFLVYTPAALQPVLTTWTTVAPMVVVMAGAAVGVVGRLRNEHLRVELWGALAIVLGFGFYILLNVLLVFLASPERVVQTVLVVLAVSFACERLRVLVPRFLDVIRSDR